MKITDNYKAKFDLWIADDKAVHLPRALEIPRFGVRRFSSYSGLNRWKRQLLGMIAKQGGVRWSR
jgi:hypothetical protein